MKRLTPTSYDGSLLLTLTHFSFKIIKKDEHEVRRYKRFLLKTSKVSGTSQETIMGMRLNMSLKCMSVSQENELRMIQRSA